MTAVTIRGTFKKDSRPDNGLEAVADEMQRDKHRLFRVVGVMKYAGASVSEEGEITPAARFLALEVVGPDDVPEHERMLDARRKARGLGLAADIPAAGQIEGQGAFEFGDPDDDGTAKHDVATCGCDPCTEARAFDEPADTNASGDPVPPASGEEILAERAERAAAPAAEFSGGDA